MRYTLEDPATLTIALAAEGGLAVLGLGLCWALGMPPPQVLPANGSLGASLGWGAAATLPLLAMFWGLQRCVWRPIARLRRQARWMVRSLLGDARWPTVAAVALSAGLGEEILFRGALQPALSSWLGTWAGVAGAAILFGMVHPMSVAYFVVATLCGLYLGVVTEATGELLPAIVAHAGYDFVALLALRKPDQTGRRPGQEELLYSDR